MDWLAPLRRLLSHARSTTGRVTAYAGRGTRGLHYLWHLLVWSRISAGRSGLLPIELPHEVLHRKGVDTGPPHLQVDSHARASAFESGFAEVYALLFANLQQADLLSPTRHAIPGPAFRGVYMWDSAFIAQVWRWWDTEVAAEVLRAVVDLRDGDRLQHVVTEFHQSRYTQPPLIAWSALAVAEALPDASAVALIEHLYLPLRRYQRWLETHRRLANGLYFWAHPYESGVENAPRFSNTDESVLRDTRAIAASDFSSYVVLQLEALQGMARRLGRPGEAAALAGEAQTLRARIDALLWDEDSGLYLDRDGAGSPVRVATIAALIPLWAGVPSAERAARLVQHLRDPASFGTPMPLPSVARGEPSFEKDMWRGPVWLNMAYAVIQGLLRYGFERDAAELAYRLCDAVYSVFERERHIYEFYDPDTLHTGALRRKRGNWWKALTLGRGPQREFVGWTGLVNNLLLEVLLGLDPRPPHRTLRLRLPPACESMTLSLDLPAAGLGLEIQVLAPNRFAGTVSRDGTSAGFEAGFAESVDLDRVLQRETPCATAT